MPGAQANQCYSEVSANLCQDNKYTGLHVPAMPLQQSVTQVEGMQTGLTHCAWRHGRRVFLEQHETSTLHLHTWLVLSANVKWMWPLPRMSALALSITPTTSRVAMTSKHAAPVISYHSLLSLPKFHQS